MRLIVSVGVHVVLLLAFSYSKGIHGADDRSRTRRRLMKEKWMSEITKDHRLAKEGDKSEEDEGRTVIVQCSQQALFGCSSPDPGRCETQIQEQQQKIWDDIESLYTHAELVSSTKKLINALYVKFRLPINEDEVFEVDNAVRQIEGVRSVTLHGSLEMEIFPAVDYVGGYVAQEQSCASGRDVRIAVLDGGIDYTHYYLGGDGTREAFVEAYGRGPRSPLNRNRDGLFPTDVVVDGFDFIGEYSNVILQDDDPIDSFGHGTAVSHAILTVAPNAKLVALKVCGASRMSCPVFALIQGLEFALDPNGDGDISDRVDIVNLSLGIPFISPFYNFVAAALERTFELGVLPVVSAGNAGNIPYVLGGLSGSPNSLSVGATGRPNDRENVGVMANYSSRGPGENNMIKPEIVAPSGLTLAAAGTGIYRYRGIQGTSFSAPLVAGAAALIMDRCPECSPFAVKALLMNNADRGTRYTNSTDALSPITWSGSGEMNIDRALKANVWAYSVEDVQPSISLGLIDAAEDLVIRRTMKVINLSEKDQRLNLSYQMRDPQNPFANALRIDFSSPQVLLAGSCNAEATVQVIFTIVGALCPPNHMTSAGREGFDPKKLDIHEFGGHIILESVETPTKDISIPFLAIVRSASDVTLTNSVLSGLSSDGLSTVNVGLINQGAGNAQVDAFQLLVASGDDPESSFGESVVPNDFKFIGYRVLEVGRQGCTHLVEFAISTWERKNGRLVSQLYGVDIDLDDDKAGDRFLFNSGLARENFVVDYTSGDTYCTGMPPDHGTSSTNTILRSCSEELGIADFEGQIGVRFEAVTFTAEGAMVRTDASGREDEFIMIDFPKPGLSMQSFDMGAGELRENIQVDGKGVGTPGEGPAGLMLVTNSFRNAESTGASTTSSETLILLREGYDASVQLPMEITPDSMLQFPVAKELTGPNCATWKQVDSPCDMSGLVGNPNVGGDDKDDEEETLENPLENEDPMLGPMIPMSSMMSVLDIMPTQRQREDGAVVVTVCPKRDVPRPDVVPPPPTGEQVDEIPVAKAGGRTSSTLSSPSSDSDPAARSSESQASNNRDSTPPVWEGGAENDQSPSSLMSSSSSLSLGVGGLLNSLVCVTIDIVAGSWIL